MPPWHPPPPIRTWIPAATVVALLVRGSSPCLTGQEGPRAATACPAAVLPADGLAIAANAPTVSQASDKTRTAELATQGAAVASVVAGGCRSRTPSSRISSLASSLRSVAASLTCTAVRLARSAAGTRPSQRPAGACRTAASRTAIVARAPCGSACQACHASAMPQPSTAMITAAGSVSLSRQPAQRATSPVTRPTRNGMKNRPTTAPPATAATPAANATTQADTGPRRLARANEGRYSRGRPGSALAARSMPSRYAPGRPSRLSSSMVASPHASRSAVGPLAGATFMEGTLFGQPSPTRDRPADAPGGRMPDRRSGNYAAGYLKTTCPARPRMRSDWTARSAAGCRSRRAGGVAGGGLLGRVDREHRAAAHGHPEGQPHARVTGRRASPGPGRADRDRGAAAACVPAPDRGLPQRAYPGVQRGDDRPVGRRGSRPARLRHRRLLPTHRLPAGQGHLRPDRGLA